jgi:hypothetical protein
LGGSGDAAGAGGEGDEDPEAAAFAALKEPYIMRDTIASAPDALLRLH